MLDLVGSYRTAIVGHGWGCSAASLFASTFPERTRSLILISASARNRWAPDYPWGFTEEVLDRSLALLESGWGTTAYAAMEVSFAAESMVEDRDYIRWVAKVQRHWVGPKAAAALEHQYWDSDVRDVLRSLRVPTLVVAREWDDRDEDEYIAGLITDARLVRFPGEDWMIWVGDQDSGRRRDTWVPRGGADRRRTGYGAQVRARSPTSWVPPRSRLRSATRVARPRGCAITRSSGRRSAPGEASRTTRPATASTPRSRAPHGRSDARRTSSTASRDLGLEVRAGVSHGRMRTDRREVRRDSPSRSAPASPRRRSPPRSWSPRRSRTWSPAPASRSRTPASTS